MHLFNKHHSKEYKQIARSKYFDKRWYLRTYPDVAAAKALLEEAGIADGEITLDLLVTAGKTFEESVATLLKEQWAQMDESAKTTGFAEYLAWQKAQIPHSQGSAD